MNNIFDFDHDNNIRKSIIDKKNIEEKIKLDLEKISYWFEIENEVLLEKEKILKKNRDNLRIQHKQKINELRSLYGTANVEKIIRRNRF